MENNVFYIFTISIFIVLYILKIYIPSMISSYANKKGENLATKEDFNELLEQQKKTTEETEKIRATINANIVKSENQRIHFQKKLEEVCLLISDFTPWIETYINKHIHANHAHRKDKKDNAAKTLQIESPIVNNKDMEKIKVICLIYFPASRDNFNEFQKQYYKTMKVILAIDYENEDHIPEQLSDLILEKNKLASLGGALIEELIKINQSAKYE